MIGLITTSNVSSVGRCPRILPKDRRIVLAAPLVKGQLRKMNVKTVRPEHGQEEPRATAKIAQLDIIANNRSPVVASRAGMENTAAQKEQTHQQFANYVREVNTA